MKRMAWVVLGVLAVVGFMAAVGIAVASSVSQRLAHGPAHAHAIGWAALCLGVAFLCGAMQSAWSGAMDVDNPYVRRSTIHLTADQDPGTFFGYLLLFFAFGIALIAFGLYRLLSS